MIEGPWRYQQLGPDRQAKKGDIWVPWGEPLCLVGLKSSDGAVWGQWDLPPRDAVAVSGTEVEHMSAFASAH